MKHKIRITTPYPTDEQMIQSLGLTPKDVAYVDNILAKIGLPKPASHKASRPPLKSRGVASAKNR